MSDKAEKARGAEVRASRARSRVEARRRSKAAARKAKIDPDDIKRESRKRSRKDNEKKGAAKPAAPLSASEAKLGSGRARRRETEAPGGLGEKSNAKSAEKTHAGAGSGGKGARKNNTHSALRGATTTRQVRNQDSASLPQELTGGQEDGGRKVRAEARRRSGAGLTRTVVLGVLFFVSLGALLWVYTGTGVLNVKNVEVKGNEILNGDYLRALSGINGDTHLLKMNVKVVEKALLSEPYIAAVDVTRRYPNTVVLEICERQPRGVILQNGKYILVDQEGMVLESADEMPPGLVEIRDLQLPLLIPGTGISGFDFASVTSLLGSLPAALREKAAVVGLRDGEGLYLEAGGTLVIYGEARDLSRKNSIALMAVSVLIARYGAVEYIDVSFPDHPVIKPAS